MSKKGELLLIGQLFGTTTDQLKEAFDLRVVPDFATPISSAISSPERLSALAVGMVGTGHIPGVAVNDAFLAQFPNLKLLASLGVGYDHIDLAAAARRGITVTNTPDANTEEVADTAMGLLLATVRQIPQADRFVRARRWQSEIFPLTGTLRGKRLGILGLGRIGKAVARRAEAFGLSVLYHGRSRQADVSYRHLGSALELARESDILMIIVPGGEETRNMVDAAVLRALGPDGVLINISRGTVVDERDLVAALRDGTIGAAGLDAFVEEPNVPEELLTMDQVVLTPHVGSATHHTRAAMCQLVVDNLMQWVEGKPVLNPVV